MKKVIVINLFGGPGSGKSTQAAQLFAYLKKAGYNAELVTEYAKDMTWQESNKVLANQLYIFAKQHLRMWRLLNKVDIIITDSPLIQNLAYAEHMSSEFKAMVLVESTVDFDNINIFLNRPESYQNHGRKQTQEQSKEIDLKTLNLLKNHKQDIHATFNISDEDTSTKMFDFALKEITSRLNP